MTMDRPEINTIKLSYCYSFLFMSQRRPLLSFLLIFSNKHHYKFYNKLMWKNVRCWNSNPRPSEHESPPITTRPGFPPLLLFFFFFFFKNGHPRPLFRLFSVFFQTNINTILQQINVKKCISSIQCCDLNPWPSQHDPITTRPGLLNCFYPLKGSTLMGRKRNQTLFRCLMDSIR